MAVSIPISMGYSQIAGLPAVYGLYGSVFPIILFALFSTSPQFIFVLARFASFSYVLLRLKVYLANTTAAPPQVVALRLPHDLVRTATARCTIR